MLLVFLRRGFCEDGLDAVFRVLGRGEPYLAEYKIGEKLFAFCYHDELPEECPSDFLVVRFNTAAIRGDHDPDYYDPTAVTCKDFEGYVDKICEILRMLRGKFYLAVVTAQPFLKRFGIYLGTSPRPVKPCGFQIGEERCGTWLIDKYTKTSIDELEIPIVKPAKPENICPSDAPSN